MRIAWPEKVAGLLALLSFLPLFLIGLIGNQTAPADHLIWGVTVLEGRLCLLVILPVWAFLRLIDLLFDGPAKRRGFFIFPPGR